MRRFPRILAFFVGLLLACLGLYSYCGRTGGETESEPTVSAPTEPVERDLAELQDRGEITMLTTTNATSYFVYRGDVMGFEYRLLRSFARAHDLILNVETVGSSSQLFERLARGDGDVVASQLTRPEDTPEPILFTDALYRSDPMLVQQVDPVADADLTEEAEELLEEGVPDLDEPVELPMRLIQKPGELRGDEVHVPGGTATHERVVELSDRLSGDVHVVEVRDELSHEALIQRVAAGEIELSAAPEAIAKLKQAYFTNVAVQPALGPPVEVAWAVRESSPRLHASLNAWLEKKKQQEVWETLYEKYFIDRRGYRERRRSRYLTSETSRLSEYDDLFRRHAEEIDWDWRLLASQSFQESRFKARAKSWAGARGLLQLMPATGRQFGVGDPYDPEDNVTAAVKFISWLEKYWRDKIPDVHDRLRIVLASYNAGHEHLQDARRLAAKYGDDRNAWEDVSFWLLQKSKRRYYTDPVVKYGFARGLEPVTYVDYILERYRHYVRFVDPDAPADPRIVPTAVASRGSGGSAGFSGPVAELAAR